MKSCNHLINNDYCYLCTYYGLLKNVSLIGIIILQDNIILTHKYYTFAVR